MRIGLGNSSGCLLRRLRTDLYEIPRTSASCFRVSNAVILEKGFMESGTQDIGSFFNDPTGLPRSAIDGPPVFFQFLSNELCGPSLKSHSLLLGKGLCFILLGRRNINEKCGSVTGNFTLCLIHTSLNITDCLIMQDKS